MKALDKFMKNKEENQILIQVNIQPSECYSDFSLENILIISEKFEHFSRLP